MTDSADPLPEPPEDPAVRKARETLQKNERAKLSATFVNGVAVALIAVGAIAPAFSIKPDFPPSSTSAAIQLATNAICLVGGLLLHILARSMMRALR